LIFALLFISTFCLLPFSEAAFAASVNVSADVQSLCGNGNIDSGEECDGSDLGGASCSSLGFAGGSLSCNSNCTFNTSACASVAVGVGIPILPILPPKPPLPTGDFNKDGLINFRDLSILLFWFDKTEPEIIPYDLNNDGKINFVDFSILLYRWKE
jgi:hypothetical protein